MSVALYPLCSSQKIAMRDGYTGASASINLMNYVEGQGRWFASGQQYTYPGSRIPQQQGLTEQTTNQKNPFVKSPGFCANAS